MEETLLNQVQDLKETVKEDDAKMITLLADLSKEMKFQNKLLDTISKKIGTLDEKGS